MDSAKKKEVAKKVLPEIEEALLKSGKFHKVIRASEMLTPKEPAPQKIEETKKVTSLTEEQFNNALTRARTIENEMEGKRLLTLLPQGEGSGLNADEVDGLHAQEIIDKASPKVYASGVSSGGGMEQHGNEYHTPDMEEYGKVKGVEVDDSGIGDGKALTYDSDSGKIVYEVPAGGGDMLKVTYDTDDDGVVDDSEKLEGSTKAQVQDHPPQAHTLGSHSTRAHSELTNIGENDHHTKFTITEHDTTDRHSLGTVVPHDDHGALSGLTDDDHTQYSKVDGTRAFSGTVAGITPTATADLATKGYVDELIHGLDWQESVLDNDLTEPPANPDTGDRYIIAPSATGDWLGHDNEITEWTGTEWVFMSLDEGTACRVEDEDVNFVWNGAAWVNIGTTVDHGVLIGLGDDDHTQYLNTTRHDTTDRHTLGTVVAHDALGSLSEKNHSSLTSVGVDDHHAGFVSLKDNAGTTVNPDANDQIQFTDDGQINADASGNTLALSIAESQIKLDDLGAPDDNTDLDVSTSKHGLCPKLSNVATEFLNGQGGWSTPAGGSSGYCFVPSTNLAITYNKVAGYCLLGTAQINQYVFAGTCVGFKIRVSGNTLNDVAVISVYKNGVITELSITVPSGSGATTLTDTGNVSFADGDYVSIIIDTTAADSGTITFSWVTKWQLTS